MTREEAIRLLSNMKHDDIAVYGRKDKPIHEAVDMAIEALKEPKQGEWINKDYGIGKCWATCSECGESTNGGAQDHGFGYDYSFPNFCPNCGARMKEGDEK